PPVKISIQKNQFLEKFKIPKNKKILLYLGRISIEKNPQFFVDTVYHLPNDWIGVMAGPVYFDKFFPKLHQRVIWIGLQKNPYNVLNICDAFMIPSKKEGGPIVLLEAWNL